MDMLYQAVAKIIEGFPPRTQVILVLYYFEGLKLGDIAKIIGHAESRVSRDHGDAILDLRDQLRSMLSPS
jgi:RNA polymerase sigma factor (sigma-70 family)